MEEIAIALLMIIIILIISTSLIIFILKYKIFEDKDFIQIIVWIINYCSIVAMFLLIAYLKKPKPIDVYRNNTTLKITYKDSIPIDSVVVWKNK